MRELADLVIFFFEKETDAPISLLELGLCAAGQDCRVLVCSEEGYSKRGYLDAVSRRFPNIFYLPREELFDFKVQEMLRQLIDDVEEGSLELVRSNSPGQEVPIRHEGQVPESS